MKYYLVEIKNTKSKGDSVKLGTYDSRDKAEAKFHKAIASAEKSDDVNFQLLAVINDTMAVEMEDVYLADGVGLPNKYYLVEISEGDASIKGAAIRTYDTRKEAVGNFHEKVGIAMDSDLYTSDRAIVLNSSMGAEKYKVYIAEQTSVE